MTTSRAIQQILLLAVLILIGMAHAQTVQRLPVTNLKPLLKQAIDHGSAHGTLVGEAAAFMRRRFRADAPIEIDVRTIQILRDPGCRRLEVTTRQAVVIQQGLPQDQLLTYQINYCRDGSLTERR